MSEITKACPSPLCKEGWIGLRNMTAPPRPCPDCHGTGLVRVPDVEATLRAQLDAARIMCERLESALRTKDSENAELRTEVARLTEERAEVVQSYGNMQAKVDILTATLAERDGDVARLEGREREAEWILKRQYGAYMSKSKFGTFLDRLNSWLAGCKS